MQTLDLLPPVVATEYIADADITAAIELFFLTKKGLSSHLIDVETYNGVVKLTGVTDNLLSWDRAQEIVLALRGVRGVINELIVNTLDVPDEELHNRITHALIDDPATMDYHIGCAVADGVVTATGIVHSWAEKQLALRVLRGVRGVRVIKDEGLTIQWGEFQNSDAEISNQIQELLDWDIRVYSSLVKIFTRHRMVYLSGTVGTAAEKSHVVSIAYQAGATSVNADELNIAYWAMSTQLKRDKYVFRTDKAITEAVLATFRFDPRVLSYQTVVLVKSGIVTLTGSVSNLRAKQDAERDARHVVGVWDVQNLLKVRTKRSITDPDLCRTIEYALARDPYVSDFYFTVKVVNGKANLYGQANNHFEQEQAGEVAAGVNGVVAIGNWIGVRSHTQFDGAHLLFRNSAALYPGLHPMPDFALADRIRTHYLWSAALYDQDIQVTVESGRVTLAGTVDTAQDRNQAVNVAYEVGAREVNNHLHLPTASRRLGSGL